MTLDAMFYTVGLLLRDKGFLDRMHQSVEPEDFHGPLQELVRLALYHYNNYGRGLLTPDALAGYVDGMEEEDAEELLELHKHCLAVGADASARPLWVEKAELWLRSRWLGRGLDEAKVALAASDVEGAREALRHADRPAYSTAATELVLETALGEVLARPTSALYIPTGIEELDDAIDGGLHPSEFGLLLAPTNVGKSMGLAIFSGAAYLADKRVLYYTSELTPEQIIRRVTAAIFKHPIKELRDARLYTQVLEQVRIQGNLQRATLRVRQMPERLSDLTADLDALKSDGEEPDLLVLDTADDLRTANRHPNLYQTLGEVYQGLRMHVAQERGYPVWTSTQANREGLDKAHLSLKHIGDSFIKAQKAHLVVGMIQTEQELKEAWAPRLRLAILKDTLHGKKGLEWKFEALFGRDSAPGYPALVKDRGRF